MLKSWLQRAANCFGYRIERFRAPGGMLLPRLLPLEPPILNRPLAEESAELKSIKSHLSSSTMQPDMPSLGERWSAYAVRLRERISAVQSVEEIILHAQAPAAGVETHLVPPELTCFCHWMELQMQDNLPRELYAA